MATWSAFSIGGIDPVGTDWLRGRDRKDAEWSIDQQKKYDQWKSQLDYNTDWQRAGELMPFAYGKNLSAQQEYYADENQLRYARMQDQALATRRALEAAGYNPLLAVDNVAGGLSASPLVAGGINSAAAHGGASVGGINRSPSANSGISGGTPYDWATARQALENQESQGDLLKAQTEETIARAEVARNTALKIKREVDTVGFYTPTQSLATITKGLENETEKGADSRSVSTARSFVDAINQLANPVQPSDGGGLSRNLINKMDKAGIPWWSLSREESLQALRRYNEKKENK